MGLAILVALAIHRLSWSAPRQNAVQLTVIATVLAACFLGTVVHQLSWANDVLLYQNGLRYVPDSQNLKDNLANALAGRGQFDWAIPLYREVLQRDPDYWRSNYNLGYALYKTGRYAEAEEKLSRAAQIDASNADQFIYLALTQFRENKLPDATQNAEHAIARSPMSPGYHYILGVIFVASGDRNRAASEFKLELTHHPENAKARGELQRLEVSQ